MIGITPLYLTYALQLEIINQSCLMAYVINSKEHDSTGRSHVCLESSLILTSKEVWLNVKVMLGERPVIAESKSVKYYLQTKEPPLPLM